MQWVNALLLACGAAPQWRQDDGAVMIWCCATLARNLATVFCARLQVMHICRCWLAFFSRSPARVALRYVLPSFKPAIHKVDEDDRRLSFLSHTCSRHERDGSLCNLTTTGPTPLRNYHLSDWCWYLGSSGVSRSETAFGHLCGLCSRGGTEGAERLAIVVFTSLQTRPLLVIPPTHLSLLSWQILQCHGKQQ